MTSARAGGHGSPDIRIVVAGWVNSPHVIAWIEMLLELGYEVALVGHRSPGWPALPLPPGLWACEEFPLGKVPLVRSMQLGRAFRQAVRRLRPDLVHAHWLPEYGWLAAQADLHPLVSSAWGSDVLGAGYVVRRRSRAAIQGADLVLADSAPLAEAARALVPHAPPVDVFHPGVDVERFHPGDREQARAALGWRPDVPIVLSPRGLSPVYNPEVIVRAFARVLTRLPDARLVLKHPGTELPERVATVIAEVGVAGSVDVVGRVEATMIPALYQAADVVVSVPSSDSSPATAWEALACGCALVVSDLPWARDELDDGENARLTPIDDGAVARTLIALLTASQLAVSLGSSGCQLARRKMNRRDRLQELDARYVGLISGAARVSGTR